MKNTIHQQIVSDLKRVDPEVRTKGFMAAIRKLLWEAEKDSLEDGEEPYDRGQYPRILPDAFKIVDDWVWCYEVEVTNPLDDRHLSDYADLAWMLDQDYIGINVVVVDRFGRKSVIANHELLFADSEVMASEDRGETVSYAQAIQTIREEFANGGPALRHAIRMGVMAAPGKAFGEQDDVS